MKSFLFLIALAALPASAQWRTFGRPPLRPTGFVGMGFSTPVNPLATRLDSGWNLAGGVGLTNSYVGIMLDAMFTNFGVTHNTLVQEGARRGHQRYWALTVDPVVHVNERGPVDFYLTGGGGLYGQITTLRTRADLPGPGSGRYDLISSESVYRPGVDAGAGFSFHLPDSNIRLFAEARYHHMFTRGSGVSFVPVTMGVRF